MANRRCWPHVVHRPHQLFARCGKSAQIAQRQQSLINPIEAHHVGGFHPRMGEHVDTVARRRHFKQIAAIQPVGGKNADTLTVECPTIVLRRSGKVDARVVGTPVNDEHSSVVSFPTERIHQAIGHDGCATEAVRLAEQNDFHRRKNLRGLIPSLCIITATNASSNTVRTGRLTAILGYGINRSAANSAPATTK